jgi:peroxiredoxin
LQAYQSMLAQLDAANVALVAISPMLPDRSLTMTEKNELAFAVLSDVGNAVARRFGLVFELDDDLKQVYLDFFKIPLPDHNGDDSWELPITATYVIDEEARIRYAFVDPDYTKRAEPSEILDALGALEP